MRVLHILVVYMISCYAGITPDSTFKANRSSIGVVNGPGYLIYRPFVNYKADGARKHVTPLIAAPEVVVKEMQALFVELDEITVDNPVLDTPLDRARRAYTEMVSNIVTAKAFGTAEKSVVPFLGVKKGNVREFNATLREQGLDNSYLGMTMVGEIRIRSMETLMLTVIKHNVAGDFMETGVWRGGLSIYVKSILRAYGEKTRLVYLCDSFAGWPPGDAKYDKLDVGWDNTGYLTVSDSTVERNFRKLKLLDSNVVFAKGFFNNTMPQLQQIVSSLAILRLVGDLYQSTIDVLFHLYEKVTINGYVIVDDWTDFPAKVACEDFFRIHKMAPTIVPIDGSSVYWKKTHQITTQYNRYISKQFKGL